MDRRVRPSGRGSDGHRGWKCGTLHAQLNGFTPATSFPIYLSWSLIQQFILLDFFLIRTLRITRGQPSAVLLAGALFAAAHVSNPLLVSLTFLWGATSCVLFLRSRDLYNLGIAHAVLGIAIAITVLNAIHHQMRVGRSYLQWVQSL